MIRTKFWNKISEEIFVSIIISFIFLIFIFGEIYANNTDFVGLDIKSEENTVGTITIDNSIKQTFISEYNGLTKLEVLLGTYVRNNDSKFNIILLDEQEKLICSKTVYATNIPDNSYFTFDFDSINDSQGKVYHLMLTSDTEDISNAITAWATFNDNYSDGKLYMNGGEVGFDLAFRVFYNSKYNSIALLVFCILMFVCAMIVSAFFLIKKNRYNITFKYLCWISSSFCLALCIIALYNKSNLNNYTVSSVFYNLSFELVFLSVLLSLLITSIIYWNCLTVIKKYKSVCYSIITLLIACCMISLFTINIDIELSNVNETITAETYSGLKVENCYIEPDKNGNIVFVPDGNQPYIYLPVSQQMLSGIKVNFSSLLTENVLVQLSYTMEEQNENNISKMVNKEDEYVIFDIPESTYSELKLTIYDRCTIKSVELGTYLDDYFSVFYKINISSIFLLIIVLMLLILFERKLHYFSYIITFFREEVNLCKEIMKDKNLAAFFLHLTSSLIKIAYVSIFMVLVAKGIINKINIITVFAIAALAIIICLIDILYNDLKTSPAKMFLIISLIASSMMSYCFPLNSISLDDGIHYTWATQLRCVLYGEAYTCADDEGWMIIHDDRINGVSSQKTCQKLLYKDQFEKYRERPNIDFYKSIGHLPMATTMFISDIFNMNFVTMIVLSKLTNAFIYTIIIYLGMRRLKSGQFILSSIVLMPTFLFLASNFSYDPWITAFTTYGFAYFISEMQQPDKLIQAKDLFLMFGSMVIGCGPKAIYFMLVFPLLFMRKCKFTDKITRKRYITIVIMVMMFILASFMMPFLQSNDNYSDMRGGADVNSTEQVRFILNNPITYTKIYMKFFFDYVSVINIVRWFSKYAYIGENIAECCTVSFIVMIVCTFWDKKKCDRFENMLMFKVTTYLVLFVQVLLISTALYVSFTPVGLDTINGTSGRYLFPLLFPLMYCIGSVYTRTLIKLKMMKFFVFGTLAMNIIWSTYTIYIRQLIN